MRLVHIIKRHFDLVMEFDSLKLNILIFYGRVTEEYVLYMYIGAY